MDVPAPAAGTVKQIKVKLGDKVSEGSVILTLEAAAAATSKPAAASSAFSPAAPTAASAPATPSPEPPKAAPAPAPGASSYSGAVDVECEMIVLGSGPGGYSAAF